MQALEQERLKALEQQQAQEDADDSILLDLDNQLKTLIQVHELLPSQIHTAGLHTEIQLHVAGLCAEMLVSPH